MKIDAILIDAGGIILDEAEYEFSCAESITNAVRKNGIEYSVEGYWRDYKQGIMEFCPQSRQYVVWKVSRYNVKLYNTIWNDFINTWSRPPLKLMPRIDVELKRLCKNYRLILAGQYGKEIYHLLESHSLDVFDNSLSQEDYDITKPDPRYLEQICARSQVDPAKSIMVGDRIDKDVIPAMYLNIKSIFVRSSLYKCQKPRIPSEMPTRTIDKINGLFEAVRDIEKTL